MTPFIAKHKNLTLVIGIALFVIPHLFFLLADPIIPNDFSRGAFTDEGLYSSQVRNYFLTGNLDMHVADGVTKTPFFNFISAPIIALNTMWVFRLFNLILITICAYTWMKNIFNKQLLTIALLIVLCLQNTFFSHCHFAMAEGFVLSFTLLSIYSSVKLKNHYLAIFFIGLAIGSKIQYAHLVVLVPVFLSQIFKERTNLFRLAGAFSPFFLLVALYILFRADYMYMFELEQVGKFQDFAHWGFRIAANLYSIFSDPYTSIIACLLLISSFGVISVFKKLSFENKYSLGVLWFAFILESHKLIYIYLPQRYLFVWVGLLLFIIAYHVFIILPLPIQLFQ